MVGDVGIIAYILCSTLWAALSAFKIVPDNFVSLRPREQIKVHKPNGFVQF